MVIKASVDSTGNLELIVGYHFPSSPSFLKGDMTLDKAVFQLRASPKEGFS